MLETGFTRLVGCRQPIQLAPVGGLALTRAVCDAGGLGMLATHVSDAASLEAELDALAATTRGVFGVNFLVPFLERSALEVAARRAHVVEFFWGEPDAELVRAARAHGARAGWQAGSLDEARAAEAAGCDYVVVQGSEAGGHVRSRTSLMPLLAQAAEVVRVPLVAAGGLATARDLAAVLAAGASAARLGTRFVASRESDAHPAYVAALLAARAADTQLTETFGEGWPNAPHRVLRSAIAAAEALPTAQAGELRAGAQRIPVTRFSALPPTRGTTGEIAAMALYAGESVENIARVEGAGDLVAALCDGAERLLRESAPR